MDISRNKEILANLMFQGVTMTLSLYDILLPLLAPSSSSPPSLVPYIIIICWCCVMENIFRESDRHIIVGLS